MVHHQDMVVRRKDFPRDHLVARPLMSIPHSSRKVHRINILVNIHQVHLVHLMAHPMGHLMDHLMDHLMVRRMVNRTGHLMYHRMATGHQVHRYYFFQGAELMNN